MKIKTVAGDIWSEMAHLTGNCLEAVKICLADNRSWAVIPLNDCKWIKGVIISPGIDLSVNQRKGWFVRYGPVG